MTKYAPNKPAIMVLLAILVVVTALFLFKSQIQKPDSSSYPATSAQPSAPVAPAAASQVSSQSPVFFIGTFPPEQEEVEVSVQKKGSSVELAWDDSTFQVFHLSVQDVELFQTGAASSSVWTISSLKINPTDDQPIRIEDTSGFLKTGYIIGTTVEGFKSYKPSSAVELGVGKKYYLQMMGFTKEGELTVGKELTLT